jgi:hypothetical protein
VSCNSSNRVVVRQLRTVICRNSGMLMSRVITGVPITRGIGKARRNFPPDLRLAVGRLNIPPETVAASFQY